MDIIYSRVAGLDVHKDVVVGCVMIEDNGKVKKEVRQFGTVQQELTKLREWLKEHEVSHVAMEATGVYWKPIFHILEGEFQLLLGNARHIKNVPGRKTDIKDCEWIANLMRCGLIHGSFIPTEAMRDLRDLTRYRVKLVQTLNSEKNRIQKVLEDTGVKLSSVVTDMFGKTGQNLLQALMQQKELSEEEVEELIVGNVKKSVSEITAALRGRIRSHHCFMIQTHLKNVQHATEQIMRLDKEIECYMQPYVNEWKLLTTIPGVEKVAAAAIIAEMGINMEQFPSSGHLASWSGICPGNNESAGKKKALGLIREIQP